MRLSHIHFSVSDCFPQQFDHFHFHGSGRLMSWYDLRLCYIKYDISMCHKGHKGKSAFSAFLYISKHSSAFLCIFLHFTVFLCISLHVTAFFYISLNFSAFHCISLHFSAFLCISLHFSAFYDLYFRTILGRHIYDSVCTGQKKSFLLKF